MLGVQCLFPSITSPQHTENPALSGLLHWSYMVGIWYLTIRNPCRCPKTTQFSILNTDISNSIRTCTNTLLQCNYDNELNFDHRNHAIGYTIQMQQSTYSKPPSRTAFETLFNTYNSQMSLIQRENTIPLTQKKCSDGCWQRWTTFAMPSKSCSHSHSLNTSSLCWLALKKHS
jgi:hypothetical protein